MKKMDLRLYLQEQCNSYRLTCEGECLVSDMLRKRSPEFVDWEKKHKIGGLAVHHIWGRTGRQHQAWCNLVLVSPAAHEGNHQRGEKSFNVGLAFEAACLAAKYKQQLDMVKGPEWLRESEQHKQHWDPECLDAIRRCCVGWKSLDDRLDYLHSKLENTKFADITARLLEVTQ